MAPADDFDPEIGRPVALEPGLRRIVADNPSPMTYRGTNTYLIGTRGLAVVDPGPASARHLEAILAAVLPGQYISHIVVTHTHLDHSQLAGPLAARSGAPVLAFGDAGAGRSAIMKELAEAGTLDGGEGIDTAFVPDATLVDGAVISGNAWNLKVMHTPGHIGNHLCLGWQDTCLTADHVMGWASSLVSPPDGDLTDFMASCERLRQHDWRVFYPGHGAPISAPAARLDWLVNHRQSRETAILRELARGPADAMTLASAIYTETPPALLAAAARNVLAHLVDLTAKSKIAPKDKLNANAQFRLLATR